MTAKPLQSVQNQSDTPVYSPLGGKPIRISKVKDAKRLLSRLLMEFQKGTIDSRQAKDMTYMLVSFVQIVKDTEMEERLGRLELKLQVTV